MKSLFHWKVLANLLLALGIFTGLVWLTFRWLEFHTKHGKEIAVPSLVNKSVQDAIKILDETGLVYEVDSLGYDPKYRPFQVIKIFPASGSRVKGGRVVKLQVNPRYYATVSVPDVLDTYMGLAFRKLERVGLKIGDTLYEPSIQRDAVIRMQFNGAALKPGTLIPRFSTIDLVIGAGPQRNISVPNLVGLTVQQAKILIAQNLFDTGLIEHDDGGQDDSDIVYYQDPESGSLRDQGMQIDIWASKKTPAEMGGKISQLNSMYRVKIDTVAPRYEDYNPPVFKEPRTIPNETVPVPTKKVEPKSAVENKNQNTTTKTVEKPKAVEKSKPKKVIVE